MSSTNKTPNYDLPQFIGTDKPTWLGDINDAMSKIDTTMKTNSNNAQNAVTTAANAVASASQAIDTANTAETSAQSAITKATSAQNTAEIAQTSATSAESTAQNAQTIATSIQSALNINSFENINANNITISQNSATPSIASSSTITIATNTEKSIAKIYGRLEINNVAKNTRSNPINIVIPTSLRPQTAITINNAIIQWNNSSTYSPYLVVIKDLTIQTNGNIQITTYYDGNDNTATIRLYLSPFLYFIKDFGDTLSPNN